MNETKISGYIHVEPKLGNYVHGDNRLGTIPLVPGGQWDAFLPEQHQQDENGFEPYDCVSEATINATETLEMQEYGTNTKWARRFLAKNSGTDVFHGNDPQTVSEKLRTGGCVGESDYPFKASDFNTFYQAITNSLKSLGIVRFAEYAYGHSWVNANPTDMMAALEYSPLSAAGWAWNLETTTGYYTTPAGSSAVHDFMVYGYIKGEYWKVRDSYFPFEKKLAWNYQFTGIKRHTLHRQIVVTQTAWNKFLAFLYSVLGLTQQTLGIGDYSFERTLGATRSPQWSSFKIEFAKTHPKICAICGTTKGCQLHHKTPFSRDLSRELDPTNLVWLCEQGEHSCHLIFGHLYSFFSYNTDLDNTIAEWSGKITNRPAHLS